MLSNTGNHGVVFNTVPERLPGHLHTAFANEHHIGLMFK